MSTDKLLNCFAEALGIPKEQITDKIAYNSIPEWDSMAHMAMVAALESEFDIMLEMDDIIAMSSFGKVRSILEKYGVKNNGAA